VFVESYPRPVFPLVDLSAVPLPHYPRKSFPVISFADPHPLTPVMSILYEKGGGRGVFPTLRILHIVASSPYFPFSKSLSCNTYGSPRKCCNQRTYRPAKPFRCNTYKKYRGLGLLWLTRNATEPTPRRARISAYRMLCFRAASNSSPGNQPASVGSHAAFDPSTNPNRAITASPVKSMSGLYSSLGW
jgi:hypothetical protein